MFAVMMGSRISSILSGRRQLRGIVERDDSAVGLQHFVDDGRRAADELQLVFALEALLDDVHVQQAEEAAAEAEAEGARDFRLVVERGVVELQLRERIAKLLVVFGVDREEPREHARLRSC